MREYKTSPISGESASPLLRIRVEASEILFLISLASIFLPWKIYPLVFLISSALFLWESRPIQISQWNIPLLIYLLYGLIVGTLTYSGHGREIFNLAKLIINPLFLIASVHWLRKRDNSRLIELMDWMLGILLLLTAIQLLIYHASFDFRLILGSSSSGQASALYRPGLFYWGLDDKNMFGARIALLGFVFLFIPVIRKNRLSILRVLFVFIVAFLSLSRTPMVALLIGILALCWMILARRWKIALIILLAIALPFFLREVIRIDSITSSNDGMGIRLVYWKAFFTHFQDLSIWGGGFAEAERFLRVNANFYRGEPHIHNTLMTTYVEFGFIGFLAYSTFLGFFAQACFKQVKSVGLWIVLFLPILSIMIILYSGYDNDIMIYLTLIWLVGTFKSIDFHQTKIKAL